jgi:hypothetical protein
MYFGCRTTSSLLSQSRFDTPLQYLLCLKLLSLLIISSRSLLNKRDLLDITDRLSTNVRDEILTNALQLVMRATPLVVDLR